MGISTSTAIRPGSPNLFFGFHIDLVEWLVPADVGLTAPVSLIVFSAVTSFITAAAGIGGGIMMVAVMAQLMPAQGIIPVHGVLPVASNDARAAVPLPPVHVHVLAQLRAAHSWGPA